VISRRRDRAVISRRKDRAGEYLRPASNAPVTDLIPVIIGVAMGAHLLKNRGLAKHARAARRDPRSRSRSPAAVLGNYLENKDPPTSW